MTRGYVYLTLFKIVRQKVALLFKCIGWLTPGSGSPLPANFSTNDYLTLSSSGYILFEYEEGTQTQATAAPGMGNITTFL